MTERTMRGLLASAGAAWLTLLPSFAFAQAFSSALNVEKDERTVKNAQVIYANVADCEDPAKYEFSVTYAANVPVIEAWMGVADTDCSMLANRINRTNGTLPPACALLGRDSGGNTREPHIVVYANQLFDSDCDDDDPLNPGPIAFETCSCDQLKGGQTYTVYIVPLDRETNSENGTGSEPESIVGTTTAVQTATFTPFTQLPDPPTNLVPLSGETRLGVRFETPASSVSLTTFKAYFDVGTGGSAVDVDASAEMDAAAASDAGADNDASGADGSADATGDLDASADLDAAGAADEAGASPETALTCGSGLLQEGQEPRAGARETGDAPLSDEVVVYLNDVSDVPLDQEVAVAAVSIDPAGNESLLSKPTCVEHIATNGFLDECDLDPKCKGKFDSCALSPTRRGSAVSLALFALALGGLIRRRRHG